MEPQRPSRAASALLARPRRCTTHQRNTAQHRHNTAQHTTEHGRAQRHAHQLLEALLLVRPHRRVEEREDLLLRRLVHIHVLQPRNITYKAYIYSYSCHSQLGTAGGRGDGGSAAQGPNEALAGWEDILWPEQIFAPYLSGGRPRGGRSRPGRCCSGSPSPGRVVFAAQQCIALALCTCSCVDPGGGRVALAFDGHGRVGWVGWVAAGRATHRHEDVRQGDERPCERRLRRWRAHHAREQATPSQSSDHHHADESKWRRCVAGGEEGSCALQRLPPSAAQRSASRACGAPFLRPIVTTMMSFRRERRRENEETVRHGQKKQAEALPSAAPPSSDHAAGEAPRGRPLFSVREDTLAPGARPHARCSEGQQAGGMQRCD